MHTQVSLSAVNQLVAGTHDNPSDLLGPHPVDYRGKSATAVRSFLPGAQAAWVVDRASGTRRPMRRLHPGGFFEAICDGPIDSAANSNEDSAHSLKTHSRYHIQMADESGEVVDMQDPYAASVNHVGL